MNSTDIFQFIGQCLHGISLSQGLLFGLFTAGLVGGMTHCAGMCGPFVLSQAGSMKKLSDAALIPYHLGRITTYVALAILLASVLNLAFLFLPVRSFVIAPILMTAGVIFIVAAFPSLRGFFPWAKASVSFVPNRWLASGTQLLLRTETSFKQYCLGLLLGFMPCGLVVSALMVASTAPTVLMAALAMAVFGLGTVPALLAVAFGGNALKAKYPLATQRFTQGMMVWSGLWLFALAGFVLI